MEDFISYSLMLVTLLEKKLFEKLVGPENSQVTKDSAPNRVNETELVIELDSFLETTKLKK